MAHEYNSLDIENKSNSCDTNQTLMPINEALALLINNAVKITETENLPLTKSYGRILANDLRSSINVPPADNSSMDGYAVRSSDFNKVEVVLPISQRIPAGTTGETLKINTVARIFTGAPVPKGADAVVMQEVCEEVGGGIKISAPVSTGDNIRRAGEDIFTGDIILKAGTKLRPQDVGLAASVGISTMSVYKRLRVGIFFTGDELKEPGEALNAGQIYNSNRHTLHGLLESLNCEVIDFGNVADDLDSTKNAMQEAAKVSDLVMTSGGVSVGEEDYIRIALEEIGQLDLWSINVKPGKPLAFGKIENTPFLGMPGNPVSVFATFCIFARPFILQSQGANEITNNSFKVAVAFDWEKAGTRNEYIRVSYKNGKLELFPNQSSGVLTSTSWANGLAFIPAGMTIKAGELIEFIPFSELLS